MSWKPSHARLTEIGVHVIESSGCRLSTEAWSVLMANVPADQMTTNNPAFVVKIIIIIIIIDEVI